MAMGAASRVVRLSMRSWRPRNLRRLVLAAAVALLLCRGLAFIHPTHRSAKPRISRTACRQSVASNTLQQMDTAYNPAWADVKERPISSLEWAHPQTFFAVAATAVYGFDMLRFIGLVKPTNVEALAVIVIYLGLYCSRYQEVRNMHKHYQVSFYASCGWTFYALASLVHALSYSPSPLLSRGPAEALHSGACAVFLGSCLYFYSYHWGRQIRHIQEGRFRPWFAVGLASLTAVHGLTVGHIWKMLEDPGWFDTIAQIYSDQWQWIADTRLAELYLTALALFLVILHLKGVLTGTRNSVWVFLGTVIVPTAALFYETVQLNAVAWQHYFMVGPKHFNDM
mmetsp:Transcript_97220/g.175649  ORF Transcript_97220/g.175649 Transcript_97220/m.175649 type:complete len:339 (-) Transcript_97220:212-1228(-)